MTTDINSILKYYFVESTLSLPLIQTQNNDPREIRVKTTLENLIQNYQKYLKSYHPDPIIISISSPTRSHPHITINPLIDGKDITSDPIIILSVYIYQNLKWFLDKHPRLPHVLDYLMHSSSLTLDFRSSPQLQQEYLKYGEFSNQVKQFILHCILLYNEYILLRRIYSEDKFLHVFQFFPRYRATFFYMKSKLHELQYILKQYNLISP